MEEKKYLPLGSIVYLENGTKKLVIVSRALVMRSGDGFLYFDYGGVPYPEGLVDDKIAYFQHENIHKVVFEGYHDLDEEATVDKINLFVERHPEIVRGSVEAIQASQATA